MSESLKTRHEMRGCLPRSIAVLELLQTRRVSKSMTGMVGENMRQLDAGDIDDAP